MTKSLALGYNLYVFVCGAAVMLLEFAASRLLAPFFGSSIFVWGNIIGVVLIALSLGYYIGGKQADRHPQLSAISKLVLMGSVFTSSIPLLTQLLVNPLSLLQQSISTGLIFSIIGSFIAITLLFAVPIFLLGMVSPFFIRLATADITTAGRTAGSLYAWSTLGSIIGTFGSAFVVVPLLGSRTTIYLAAALLATVAAIALKRWRYLLAIALPIVLAVALHGSPLRADAAVIEEGESLYQYYAVTDTEDRLLLQYNEGLGTQSFYMKEGVLTGSYYDYIALAPTLQGNSQRALVLGLAGGTLTRQLTQYYPELAITGVEIDPKIVDVASRHFALDEQLIQIVVDDGRNYVQANLARQQSDPYDLIFIDVYANEYYIPWHMTTVEFFQSLAQLQSKQGMVVMNVGSSDEDTVLFQAMLQTLQQVYPYLYIVHVPESLNYAVYAAQQPVTVDQLLPIQDERTAVARTIHQGWHAFTPSRTVATLTDDRAPVELYTEAMIWNYIFN